MPERLMVLMRRFLVIGALLFWQGGFTFYASVVVPVGQEVLGSHLHQGFITRQVTVFLNLAGAVALLPLTWDLVARDPALLRRWLRAALVVLMLASLIVLFREHARLDRLLDPETLDIANRKVFRPGHRFYLWVSTVQWGAALAYLALSLAAWRAADRLASHPDPESCSAKGEPGGVSPPIWNPPAG